MAGPMVIGFDAPQEVRRDMEWAPRRAACSGVAAFISLSDSKRCLFMSTVFDEGDATGIAGFRRG